MSPYLRPAPREIPVGTLVIFERLPYAAIARWMWVVLGDAPDDISRRPRKLIQACVRQACFGYSTTAPVKALVADLTPIADYGRVIADIRLAGPKGPFANIITTRRDPSLPLLARREWKDAYAPPSWLDDTASIDDDWLAGVVLDAWQRRREAA